METAERPGDDSFCWVGMFEPDRAELDLLAAELGLDPLAVDDAMNPHQRVKLEEYGTHSFLVVRTIQAQDGSTGYHLGQIAVFFSDIMIVTVRHGALDAMASVRTDLESDPQRLAAGPIAVVHEILDRVVDDYLDACRRIADLVHRIEDDVFDDAVPARSKDIYSAKREIIYFRRAVAALSGPVEQLMGGAVTYAHPAMRFRLADVSDHLIRVMEEVDALERILDASFDANSSRISLQMNTDMRKISAWAGIAAVPTMIAGIYGMNFDHMPELRTSFGYFIVLGLVAAICGGMFRAFRGKEWL